MVRRRHRAQVQQVTRVGSLSGALAMMRLLGSGNPPLHRFRVGVEFAVSGHRDMNNMIAQHSALARRLAEQLGLPEAVQEASAAAYEQWDGKGWPGNLRGDAIPIASRLAQIGEFTEVAHRIGGTAAAVSLAEKRAGTQFDPELAATFCTYAEVILGRARRRRDLGRGHRRGAIARRLPVARRIRRRSAGHRRLRRPEVALHARARPRRVGARLAQRERRSGSTRRRWRCFAVPASFTGWDASACPTPYGTSRAPSAQVSGNGCACTPISPSAC